MSLSGFTLPPMENEPVLGYLPGSPERKSLQDELKRQSQEVVEIPCIINGEEVWTGNIVEQVMPHKHAHVIARVHLAGEMEIRNAIEASLHAHQSWSSLPWQERAAVFIKAADLLAGERRAEVNASTMLNQSKTCHQAEIDSACELIDFWRLNAHFAQQIYQDIQPPISPEGIQNSCEGRALEGFIFAVTPFNFTSIAGNLPSAPALMGNTAVWKPSRNSYLSNYKIMQLMMDAGLPAGVINFVPARASEISDICMSHPMLAGIHFTGSTGVFDHIWTQVGKNLPNLRSYPRIVGETGGKDFIVAHPDCKEKALLTAMLRGAFEFQGQKCSAASRCYIPTSVWERIKQPYIEEVSKVKMGDPADFTNLVSAVIDEKAFNNITGYIERARESGDAEIITGGNYDSSVGWFIEPTTIVVKDPQYESMQEEIFGPVLTVYIYDDEKFEDVLKLCDETSPYSLTGSIFANQEADIEIATKALRYSSGNYYINDKPTGAVVGQQPFGGARGSGTNDKAGSPINLMRWVSVRTVKRNFNPPEDWRYGFLKPDE